jgi:hypothetical protein
MHSANKLLDAEFVARWLVNTSLGHAHDQYPADFFSCMQTKNFNNKSCIVLNHIIAAYFVTAAFILAA